MVPLRVSLDLPKLSPIARHCFEGPAEGISIGGSGVFQHLPGLRLSQQVSAHIDCFAVSVKTVFPYVRLMLTPVFLHSYPLSEFNVSRRARWPQYSQAIHLSRTGVLDIAFRR